MNDTTSKSASFVYFGQDAQDRIRSELGSVHFFTPSRISSETKTRSTISHFRIYCTGGNNQFEQREFYVYFTRDTSS